MSGKPTGRGRGRGRARRIFQQGTEINSDPVVGLVRAGKLSQNPSLPTVQCEEHKKEEQKSYICEEDTISSPSPSLPTISCEETRKEDRKTYTGEELKTFQYVSKSLEKPDCLEQFPELQQRSTCNNPSSSHSSGDGWRKNTRGYVKQTNRSDSGSYTEHQKNFKHNGYVKTSRKIINIGLTNAVKLRTAENAWAPAHKKAGTLVKQVSETHDILKEVTSILNKLTPQKFKILVDRILNLNFSTEERLAGLVNRVCEKAFDEPVFSKTYANLVIHLLRLAAPSNDDPAQIVCLQTILLRKCQSAFQQDRQKERPEAKDIKETDAMKIESAKSKRHSMGIITFIGELFKLGIVSDRIMHSCVKSLMKYDEHSLECLCRLLTTIGKFMDISPNRQQVLSNYFSRLENIVKTSRMSSRIKFAILDLKDLRSNKWLPRWDDGPKSITAIHHQAEQEKLKDRVSDKREHSH